jgi:hypothetical protein
VLVIATIAAMFVTQRVRRHGLVLDKIKVTETFTPDGDNDADKAVIRFRLTRAETVDITVLDSDDDEVATVAEDEPHSDHKLLRFYWNGFEDDGAAAPPGTYSLRIFLEGRDRTITPSETITLVPTSSEDDEVPG